MEKGFFGKLYSGVEKSMYRKPILKDTIPKYISDRYIMDNRGDELEDIEAVTSFRVGNNNVTIIRQWNVQWNVQRYGNECYFRINEEGIGLDLFYIIYISDAKTVNDYLFSYYSLYFDILDIIYKQVGQFNTSIGMRNGASHGTENGYKENRTDYQNIECHILAYMTLKSMGISAPALYITTPALYFKECRMTQEMKDICELVKNYIDENIINSEPASDLITSLLDYNHLFSIMNNVNKKGDN